MRVPTVGRHSWWYATLAFVVGMAFWFAQVNAHEVKVMLDRWSVPKGEKDVVFLSWGHRLPTDGLTKGEDVEQYRLITPAGSVRTLKTEAESDQRNTVDLDEEGVYTASAIRKPAVMTVFRFEGRHVHFVGPKSKIRPGATVEESFRSYQYSKALAVAGTGAGPNNPKPVGHTLEITPSVPASEWVVGREIPFLVTFEGKPISGRLFQAKPLDFKPDDVWTWTRPTDEEGVATLRPDRPGTWLLKATIERPAALEHRTEFDADHWTATLLLEIKDAAR